MTCTEACQEIQVVRLLGSFYLCLFLNYVKQTKKKTIIKKLLSTSEYGIFKTKDKFITTVTKRVVLTLYILKQTFSQKLLVILSMYDLLLLPTMRVLKGETVKEKNFREFNFGLVLKQM